ncbi:hypothetical protein AHAS_Ahas15G0079200 [Arachis hypogaea]
MKTFSRTEVAWSCGTIIIIITNRNTTSYLNSAAALGVGPTTVSDDQSPSRSAFLVTVSAVGSGTASGAGSGAGTRRRRIALTCGAGHAARAVASIAKPMSRALRFPRPSAARGSSNSPLSNNNSFLLLMFSSAKEIMYGGWQQQRRKTKDEGCEIWNLRKKI